MSQAVFQLQRVDTPEGAPSVARVSGDVDVTNAEDFTESISALSSVRPVVVDLSLLNYLDSAGFDALDRLLAADKVSIVIAPDSPIHRAAVVMELPFQQDTGSAIRSLAGEG